MEDDAIYTLYFQRNEGAIAATHQKYGSWCRGIAHRILNIKEETEECVSDTYLTAWNNIPPQKPAVFRAWLGKITRNLALDRWRKLTAEKRGGGETDLALEELSFCVSGSGSVDDTIDSKEIGRVIDLFLSGLSDTQRNIFLRRYWHLSSIREIAESYHMSEGKVRSLLFRLRKKLKDQLEREGIDL